MPEEIVDGTHIPEVFVMDQDDFDQLQGILHRLSKTNPQKVNFHMSYPIDKSSYLDVHFAIKQL